MKDIKIMQEFERMIKEAKLRAFSKVSLERPLDEEEFNEMKQLFNELYKERSDNYESK